MSIVLWAESIENGDDEDAYREHDEGQPPLGWFAGDLFVSARPYVSLQEGNDFFVRFSRVLHEDFDDLLPRPNFVERTKQEAAQQRHGDVVEAFKHEFKHPAERQYSHDAADCENRQRQYVEFTDRGHDG